MAVPRLIGVVHLPALPGAPRHGGDMAAVVRAARRDAAVLARAGFDAVVVENFGDAPFFADAVPPVTVAAITRAVLAVREETGLPVGVNVLRNDARAAVSIAAATGAAFVRVNVLTGVMTTDQGPITGRAAEVTRLRAALNPAIVILADVMVKHAVPPPGLSLEQAAADTALRGGADALVVTGSSTGVAPALDLIRRTKRAAAGLPVLVGSGVTAADAAAVLEVADGIIVGTSLKRGGRVTNPVDARRARRLVEAAGPARRPRAPAGRGKKR